MVQFAKRMDLLKGSEIRDLSANERMAEFLDFAP